MCSADAYEYPLQYTPVGAYEALTVVGLHLGPKTVSGNCSYTAIRSGSGRDPRQTYIPMPQTCTWSLFGVLQSTLAGAPLPQDPLTTSGTQVIFARKSAHLYAGTDSALPEGGFVWLYGPHYAWAGSGAHLVLPFAPYSLVATLTTDGDAPLNVTSVKVSHLLAGVKLKVAASTCKGLIAVGAGCSVTIAYDDSQITSPSGLAYDTVTIHLNAGAYSSDFTQGYTLEVPLPSDN